MTAQLWNDGRVARLRLDRPDRRNAFDAAMVRDVGDHLDAVSRSSVDVLIVEGAGQDLCAGGDVREMVDLSAAGPAACRAFFADLFGLLDMIVALPQVVVCRVQGVAAGFGLALVLNADIAIAGRGARLGAPELRLGLRPTGVAAEAVRWMPPAAARSWLLRPRLNTADEARAVGVIAEVVDDVDLDDAVTAIVQDLLAVPAAILRSTKALYRELERTPTSALRDRSLEAATETLVAPGVADRLRVFVERGRG